jgi:hypothetical protein
MLVRSRRVDVSYDSGFRKDTNDDDAHSVGDTRAIRSRAALRSLRPAIRAVGGFWVTCPFHQGPEQEPLSALMCGGCYSKWSHGTTVRSVALSLIEVGPRCSS